MYEVHRETEIETETPTHTYRHVDPVDVDTRVDTVEEHVVVSDRTWSPAAIAAVIVGALLLVIGIVAMIRADVGSSFTAQHVDVAGLEHTALLGVIEAAAGALLLIAGASRSRGTVIFVSAAMVIFGVVILMEHESLTDDLGVDSTHGWWAIGLGGGLLLIAALTPWLRTEHVVRHETGEQWR
jgi:hypothetical protein